jgi:hypothetical protein
MQKKKKKERKKRTTVILFLSPQKGQYAKVFMHTGSGPDHGNSKQALLIAG